MTIKELSSDIQSIQPLLSIMSDIEKLEVENNLTRWHKETELKYIWRRNQTYFEDFITPTIRGVSSILTRKKPLKYGENMSDLLQDSITKTIETLSKLILRDGSCLLFPVNIGTSDNKIDDINVKTRIDIVEKAQVLSYQQDENGNYIQIVIKSNYNRPKGDYDTEKVTVYTRYFIGGGERHIAINEGNPVLDDSWTNSFNYVPFVVVGDSILAETKLKNIAKLNLSHYNLKSGIMNIVHIASNPVPVMYGMPQNDGLTIGVNTPIMFSEKDRFGFEWVEIKGSSVVIAEREVKAIEDFILNGTFNLLKDTAFITATEARIQDGKNKSILNAISDSIENGLNRALEIVQDIAGITVEPIELNKDFSDLLLDADRLRVLLDLRKNRDLSFETLMDILIKGEIIDDLNIMQEKDRINNELIAGE